MSKCIMFVFFPALLYAQFDVYIPLKIKITSEKYELQGKVSSVEQTEYFAEHDEIPSALLQKIRTDLYGTSFSHDSVIIRHFERDDKIHMEFNERNQITSYVEHNKKGMLNKRRVYEYDSGKLKKITEYDKKNSVQKIKLYTHDEAGRLSEEKITDGSGKLKDRNELRYDARGNVVLQLDYDSDNKLERRTIYQDYDSFGNWKTKITTSSDRDGKTKIYRRAITY